MSPSLFNRFQTTHQRVQIYGGNGNLGPVIFTIAVTPYRFEKTAFIYFIISIYRCFYGGWKIKIKFTNVGVLLWWQNHIGKQELLLFIFPYSIKSNPGRTICIDFQGSISHFSGTELRPVQ